MISTEIVQQIINDLEFEKMRLSKTRNRFELLTRDRDVQELNQNIAFMKKLKNWF